MVSVGIAIPVLNGARYLGECLDSLMRMTIPFQAILQDGGSTDDSLEIAEAMVGMDERFEILQETDTGQSDALNRAWTRLVPNHDLVTWLNADDLVHPHGMAQALAAAVENPSAIVTYGAFLVIDEDGLIREFVRRPPRLRLMDLLYVDSLVPGVASLCRSTAVREVGMFDEDLHYALDHDLFVRLAQRGPIQGVSQPTFSFRWHAGSKTAGTEALRSREEAREVSVRYRRLHGVPATALSALLRGRYRAMKTVGERLPVERYGSQIVTIQP